LIGRFVTHSGTKEWFTFLDADGNKLSDNQAICRVFGPEEGPYSWEEVFFSTFLSFQGVLDKVDEMISHYQGEYNADFNATHG